jgi:hypothetical protein
MKRQNLGKINSSNYQSLYLWTSFLLGMISLGFIIWQRRQTFSFIPAKSNIISNNSIIIPANAGIQLSPSKFLDSRLHGDDKFSTSIIFTPLILSATAYQQSGSVATGLLFGLGSYFTQVKAQPTVPALTVNLNNLKPNEGIVFSSGTSIDVGDVNGDGHVDMLIGNYQANAAYLIYGPNFESSNNLAALNASQTVTFLGGDQTGSAVKIIDINKDGKLDLLIGASTGGAGAQKVYLVYGNIFTSIIMLDNLNFSQGVVFYGSAGTGYSFDVGDLNNDNHTDLIIGAYAANKVYLVYGPDFLIAANLENLNSSQGLIFSGPAGTGVSVFITDVTKDGSLDILIGAYSANEAFLIYGPNFTNSSNLNSLSSNQGVIFSGALGTGGCVYANDVNNDGYVDVLIGAQDAAKTYLVYGPNFSNATNLDSLSNSQGIIFSGGINTGWRIVVTDANNDGYKDVFIGAYDAQSVYLVFGPSFAQTTDLNNLNVTQGIVFTGGQKLGFNVLLYDFNNDSTLDAFICSNQGEPAYLVYNHVFNVLRPVFTTSPSSAPSAFVLTTTSITTPMTATLVTASSPTKTVSSSGEASTITTDRTSVLVTTSIGLTTFNSLAGSTPIILNTQNNGNFTGDIAGVAVGACVAGALLTAAGFFATNKCRKKKDKANNNSNAMQDIRENNQNIDLGNNSARRDNSNQYQTAPVFDSRYNSARLQHQDQHPTAATPTNTQNNYRDIDETKKTEEQYENVPKLEI